MALYPFIRPALKPVYEFAGFTWPRMLATLDQRPIAARLAAARKPRVTGGYYHCPAPDLASGPHGFYLGRDGNPSRLRWTWCDKVEGADIEHTGWFIDDDWSCDKIRGIVVRLPKSRGFLAGWSMGEGMASVVDLSSVYQDETDAANEADRQAELAAEDERDYQRREREEEN